jgi:hypothetical protein
VLYTASSESVSEGEGDGTHTPSVTREEQQMKKRKFLVAQVNLSRSGDPIEGNLVSQEGKRKGWDGDRPLP